MQEHRVAAFRLLLDAGAAPNKGDNYGNDLLLAARTGAASEAQEELIIALLDAGTEPDHKNRAEISAREVAIEIAHGLEALFARLAAGYRRRSPRRRCLPKRRVSLSARRCTYLYRD